MVIIYGFVLLILFMICPVGIVILAGLSLLSAILGGMKGR